MTEAEDYAKMSIELMQKHCAKLADYASRITSAMSVAKAPAGMNAGDVLKEIAGAAQTCESTIEYFGDEDPIPWSVSEAIMNTQRAMADGTNAIIFMMALIQRAKG